MRRSTIRPVARAALAVGAVAVAGLAFAPSAAAVSPGSATATYDCGTWGGGSATLTATQSGTAATITLTSAVTTPIAVGANQISANLTLAKGARRHQGVQRQGQPRAPARAIRSRSAR